jgi:transketolase
MTAETMRDRFARVATELLDTDPRVALVLADIGTDRFRATGAIERHPDRVINVGIREQLMVSTAGGLALEGFRAIAHSYAPFLVERSFEQVRLDFVHQGVGGILVSVGASYDWTMGGRTHHAPEDVALLSTLPGWTIHVPGHPDEAEAALRAAAAGDDAVYIRLSDRANREPHPVDRVTVIRRGSPGALAVFAVGPMLDAVETALEGIDATLLYTPTIRPLDGEGLRAAVTGDSLAIVEPYLEGTSLPTVSGLLSDRPMRYLAVGVPNAEHRRYGSPRQHDAAFGLDAPGLRERLAAWLEPVPA